METKIDFGLGASLGFWMAIEIDLITISFDWVNGWPFNDLLCLSFFDYRMVTKSFRSPCDLGWLFKDRAKIHPFWVAKGNKN
jgi:hypothetical protein